MPTPAQRERGPERRQAPQHIHATRPPVFTDGLVRILIDIHCQHANRTVPSIKSANGNHRWGTTVASARVAERFGANARS